MADESDNTVKTLTAKLVQQCAGHVEVPAFIADVDALIAAVRADHRITVVKLRDDETLPVAAPCAIAGACQYGEARRCPVCGIPMTCLHPASHLS